MSEAFRVTDNRAPAKAARAAELMAPDADGPPGNLGQAVCGACREPGWLMGRNDAGWLFQHPGRLIDCRVPLDPPGVVDGEIAVPVEISEN